MGTGALTDRSAGEVIIADFFNSIHSAMNGDFVGRNASGAATSGQAFGTAAIPWGTVRAGGLVINGASVDVSQVAAPPFRVISGAKRSTSNQPAYIDPAGAGNGASFVVLATAIDLVFDVNAVAFTLAADITKSSLSAAPSSNNTALVNDADAADGDETRLWGELDGSRDITIDAAGSSITGLVNTWQVFKVVGVGTEYFTAYVESSTQLTNAFRGYFYDDSLDPINRTAFTDDNVITLMKAHWIFMDKDLTTVDTTTKAPHYGNAAPSSPATGDYWFDTVNKLWKRHDGASFQTVNRTYIGIAVMDATDCVAARSVDFDARYKSDSSLDARFDTTSIFEARGFHQKSHIAGTELDFGTAKPVWNITTDLAASVDMYNATEQASTLYYLYAKDDGEEIISDIEPFWRADLFGYYHPHNPWRFVKSVFNDSSSDLVDNGLLFLPPEKPNSGTILNADILTISAGFGTVTVPSVKVKRMGGSLVVAGYFKTGTTAASVMSFTLPSYMQIDSAKYTTTSQVNSLGKGELVAGGGAQQVGTTAASFILFYDGSDVNTIFVGGRSSSDTIEKTNGNSLISAGDGFGFRFEVAIAGWRAL